MDRGLATGSSLLQEVLNNMNWSEKVENRLRPNKRPCSSLKFKRKKKNIKSNSIEFLFIYITAQKPFTALLYNNNNESYI
jgi:hypothetical protein